LWTNENDIHANELIKQYWDSNQPINTIKKNHGKTRNKMYIRTFRIDKEIVSTSPHLHMSSPLSPTIQINGEENALLYLLMLSCSASYVPRTLSPSGSYHSPIIHNPFHRLPLSSAGESVASGTNANEHIGGPGPYPDEYELGSANELLNTWRLCHGAIYYFRIEWVLPDIL